VAANRTYRSSRSTPSTRGFLADSGALHAHRPAGSGCGAGDVLGVATTSQREGCVFLDAAVASSTPAQLDSRAFMEGLEVLGTLGVQRCTRSPALRAVHIPARPLSLVSQARWPRGGAAAHDQRLDDLPVVRVASTEPSNAAESMLFDLRGREWSAEILQQFDIPSAMLPPIFAAGDCVGAVHEAAAAVTGLAVGTPVFAGGADTQCALSARGGGGGATSRSSRHHQPGTSGRRGTLLGPRRQPCGRMSCGSATLGIESKPAHGRRVPRLLDLLVHRRATATPRRSAGAKLSATPGRHVHWPASVNLTKATPDMPGGLLFRSHLQLRPTAGEVLRAFLESVAYAVRANVAQIEAGHRKPTLA